ncbi:MAG: hypothetical protein DRP70_04055 [Spirochaetes bacterium]|nr:MAG: hypothetical protein DRP60_14315 [Spirochaetota bacterium]RKX89348.1 MAG: hypothetical protein DRP70_04055 [Spirochaetota bacterium]RKX98532.1 MAG: hypothetical protein DRZ90_02575 [Spirochaetota bacterium]
MLFSDDMKELLSLFEKYQVEYAVCGGFAVAHYGFIRATMDFDLLVSPGSENAGKIMQALRDFGFGDSGISDEAFLNAGAAVTLGAQPNQIDLLTSMSSHSTDQIISRAKIVKIKEVSVKMVSYEDLLSAKLEAGRPKDLIDYNELKKIPPDATSE